MGAEMANRWRLPVSLQKSIEFHHRPSGAGEYIKIASAVHIADTALMMLGLGLGKDGLRYNVDQKAFEIMEWSEDRIPDLFDKMTNAINAAEIFIGVATP